VSSNICIGCRFGSSRIEILVPEDYNIQDFAKETQNFASEIIAIKKVEAMHYSLTFGSLNDFSKLEFIIHCSCILNVDKKQCSKLNSNQEKDSRIKDLIYSKEGISDKICVTMGE
jgi:hypothetical protein